MQSELLEKASTVITNSHVLVNVISRRVRQLMNGHRPLVETGPRMGLADIALTEVIDGKFSYEQTTGFTPELLLPRRSEAGDSKWDKKAA